MIPRAISFHPQDGQGLILMVLAATVIFAAGAIAIDIGLWLSERRGAQKDADASTLAGAYELLGQDFVNIGNNDFPATQTATEQAALTWADLNGVPEELVHDLLVANTNCLGFSAVLDTVSLSAEHVSRPLFASIFNVSAPQIGGSAKACLGSIVTAEGLLPVGIQISGRDSDCWEDMDGDGEEDPLFGQDCVLTFGGGDLTSGEGGYLRLYDDGSQACSGQTTGGGRTLFDEIEQGGANTECHVYKYFDDPTKSCADDPGGCVYSQTRTGGGTPAIDAFETLLSTEGECDAKFGNGDGIDQLLEILEAVNGDTTPSPDTTFARRDCESPRHVSLIIVRRFSAQGNPPNPIETFASFVIEGCEVETNQGLQFSAKCRKSEIQGNIGQVGLRGRFINLLESHGAVGQISKWSPKRIILVE